MLTSDQTRAALLKSQRNEATERLIYERLSASTNDAHNKKILSMISLDEERHYYEWKNLTGVDVSPDGWKVASYCLLARIFGLTFALKIMENGEEHAQETYARMVKEAPVAKDIIADEERHEKELLSMIDEEQLKYTSSIVLGLNDALVELTGSLAGLSFAFQNTRVIAVAGLITGIAASLSMAASAYLSTKAEQGHKNPLKSAIYTGITYVLTVMILIAPYFLHQSYVYALINTLAHALILIAIATFYIATTQNQPYTHKFKEMALISMGVTAITFLTGYLIKTQLGIDL